MTFKHLQPRKMTLDDLDKIIADSSEKNRNFFIAYLILLIYTQFIIFSTTDLQLLAGTNVSLPFAYLTVPLKGFYFVAPIFIITLHLNFLQNLEIHHYKLMRWLYAQPEKKAERARVQAFLFDHAELGDKGLFHPVVRHASNFLCLHFAPFTIGLLLWRYSDLQDPVFSIWYFIIFLLECICISHFKNALEKNKSSHTAEKLDEASLCYPQAKKTQEKPKQPRKKRSLTSFIHVLINFFGNLIRHYCITTFFALFLFILVVLSCTEDWSLDMPVDEIQAKEKQWFVDKIGISTVSLLIPIISIKPYELSTASNLGNALKPTNPPHITAKRLQFAKLPGVNMEQAELQNANMQNADLSNAILSRADLTEANLSRANLEKAHLENAKLLNAFLRNATLTNSRMNNANFSKAHLEDAELSFTQLQEAKFDHAHLIKVTMRESNLTKAILTEALLNNADLNKANLRNVTAVGTHFDAANLNHAIFHAADLNNASFQGADLSQANFQGATLTNSDFRSQKLKASVLKGTNFQGAALFNANFQGADLSHANFQGSDLSHANFQGATLFNADFRGAILQAANFKDSHLIAPKFQGALFYQSTVIDKSYLQNKEVYLDNSTPINKKNKTNAFLKHKPLAVVSFIDDLCAQENIKKIENTKYSEYIEQACDTSVDLQTCDEDKKKKVKADVKQQVEAEAKAELKMTIESIRKNYRQLSDKEYINVLNRKICENPICKPLIERLICEN